MKHLLYTIELKVKGLDEKLIKNFENIAKDHNYDAFYDGPDRLVIASERFNDFTGMVNQLSRVCDIYGVDYISMLV